MEKDFSAYWWALTSDYCINFYGNGATANPHHNGGSTQAIKVIAGSDNLVYIKTKSGSEYKLTRSKMIPSLSAALNWTRFTSGGRK